MRPLPLGLIALSSLAFGALAGCTDRTTRTVVNTSTAAAATSASPSGTTSGTTTTAPTTSAAPAAPTPRTKTAQVVARYGQGFLETDHSGQMLILHTKGSAYERGFQYGYLVGDRIEGVFNALHDFAVQQAGNVAANLRGLLAPAGALIYRQYFDADALEEIRGIVAGCRAKNPSTFINEQELIFVNSIIDIGATLDLSAFKCSSIAVWGDLSVDRKLFQTRNVDLMVGTGLENYALVVVAKPDGGVPYMNPGWAGMIGAPSGLNAHGMGIGQVWAFSTNRGFGRPWGLATREILARGSDVDFAVNVFRNDRRTYGSNFVFTDRGDARNGQPRAVAVESTQHHLAVFESDDPKEDLALWNGQPYGIRIKDAVFRGDAALDPLIRSLQTASNGPNGDPRAASAYRNRYKGQADKLMDFVSRGIKVGAPQLIELSKAVAMPSGSLQCVVYANTDLEVWVANSRIDAAGTVHNAMDEPYRQASLDYYTPTARVVPDSAQVAAGASVDVAVALETLGRARALDVRLYLEVGTTRTYLGGASMVLPERGRGSVRQGVAIPAQPGTGNAALVAEVVEAGTQDLVDIAITPIQIR